MEQEGAIAVLSVGQNGQVTIPSRFRKEHSLRRGGKLIAVRMGDALVMMPHDGVLESVCMRLEEAMKGARSTVAAMKQQALAERAEIVRKRYK